MSRDIRISRRAAMAGAAGAAFLGASGLTRAQSTDRSDAEVVRVGVVKIGGVADIHTAQKLGYFRDEGLNVETVVVRSGAEAQAAVVAGRMEFLPLNCVSFIFGLHEGFGFKAAADGFRAPMNPPGTSAVLVRNDNSVNTPADLERKTVGVVSRKGLHELYFTLWCRKHNVDIAKVRMLEVPYGQMIDVVTNRQVDAVLPLEPIITRGLADGRLKVLAFYDSEVEPGHANGLWVGMGRWMDAHPIATRKFQAAVYRAHATLTGEAAQASKMIAEWTDLAPEVVEKMGRDLFATDMPLQSMEGIARSMRELGWIQKEVNIADALWRAKT